MIKLDSRCKMAARLAPVDWQIIEREEEWQQIVPESQHQGESAIGARHHTAQCQWLLAVLTLIGGLLLLFGLRQQARLSTVGMVDGIARTAVLTPTSPAIRYLEPWEELVTRHFRFVFPASDAQMVATIARSIEQSYGEMRRAVGLPATTSIATIVIILVGDNHPSTPISPRNHLDTRLSLVDLQAVCTSLSQHNGESELRRTEERCPPEVAFVSLDQPIAISAVRLPDNNGVNREQLIARALADQLAARLLSEKLDGQRIAPGWSPLLAGIRLWLPRHRRLNTALAADTLPVIDRQAAAAVTLVEYAIDTYGSDKLPQLLAALAQHDTWQTLVPAVFGLPAEQFERAWQASSNAIDGSHLLSLALKPIVFRSRLAFRERASEPVLRRSVMSLSRNAGAKFVVVAWLAR